MNLQRIAILIAGFCGGVIPVGAQSMPPSIAGKWRIVRILPTHNPQCWNEERARTLLGTTLTYRTRMMIWHGGLEPINEVFSRTLTRRAFQDEYKVDLAELGIAAATVTEFDLQHEDADVTGSTIEVPGDTIVVAGPGKIVVSACGVFYSAVRVTGKADGER